MTEEKKSVSLSDIPDVKKFFEGASPLGPPEKKPLPRQKTAKTKEKKAAAPTTAAPPTTIADIEDIRPKTAVERYKESLADFDIDMNNAMEIIDSLITQNSYKEDTPITKSLSVTFRTRTSKAMSRLSKALDESRPQYDAAYYTLIAQHNLASSIIEYGDYTLDPDTSEGYDQSLAFIEGLPGPLFNILTEKLNRFDQKVSAVMKEGCIENF